jgi:hypothetical protein
MYAILFLLFALYCYIRSEEHPKNELPKITPLLPEFWIKKPVRFISNSRMLPERTNLTVYYSRVIDVPVSLPSFDTEVIEICARYTLFDVEQDPSVSSDQIKAAEHFLTDRIIYASCQN